MGNVRAPAGEGSKPPATLPRHVKRAAAGAAMEPDLRAAPHLRAAMAELDMAGIVVVVDSDGDVLIAATSDLGALVRQIGTYCKAAVAHTEMRYAPGKEVARTLVASAVCRLERAGAVRRGRWMRATPAATLAALESEAAAIRCQLLTPAERPALLTAQAEE